MDEVQPAPGTRDHTAPAKINLYLHVTGRRGDGYHLLDSLIAFAGVGDTLGVAPAEDLTLDLRGPFAGAVPAGGDNLVMKAARALADAAGVEAGARMTLEKALPPASGIGGGSADAAAALRALAALWGVEMDADALAELALGLGADVPVCLGGRAAQVGGIGEEMTPLASLPPAWVVLANAGVRVETAAVFAALDGEFSAAAPLPAAVENAWDLAAALGERRNDLTRAAARAEPMIEKTLDALDRFDGVLLTRMSGSGATCFSLFDDAEMAAVAAVLLTMEHPDWWVAAAPLLADASKAAY